MQSTPQEIFQQVKKHKNNSSLTTQPQSINNRDFLLHNITLRSGQDCQDFLNFRRGLAYIEQIISHKHENFTIAKKGLRKFHDLMPEYLDIKSSHFNKNKHHNNMKMIFLNGITNSNADKIKIYNTQKLNGENMQISCVYDQFWVIGTKNKTLLLRDYNDIQSIKYKHQHNITIKIAKLFFKYLQKLSEQQINRLKQFLQTRTLIGQFLNPQTSQHVVEYKQVDITFFALVDKFDRKNSCLSVGQLISLCKQYGFKHAKYNQIIIKNQEQLILQKLTELVVEIEESKLQEKGQGSVLYIEEFFEEDKKARNMIIAKVKTLEYRIYRKLREKLKLYIDKAKKGHEKMLKKYVEEVKQLVRQFETPQKLQYYFQIAERAFILCEDQTKNLIRMVSNQFVTFLKLVKDKELTKNKFMDIVNKRKNNQNQQEEDNNANNQQMKEEKQQGVKSQNKQSTKVQGQKHHSNNANLKKRVLVFVPMTIPATGKTTLFNTIKQTYLTYPVHIISSDTVRQQVMKQKMKKNKSMSSRQAFQKSRKQANDRFYEQISRVYKSISKSQQSQHVFLIDKNHPENALKTGVSEYKDRAKKFANIEIKIVCLLPYCSQTRFLNKKGKYYYPFSTQYILTCLKRVSLRQQHQTLQGSLQQRLNIVINFTNMFRNYHLTAYNLSKYYDYMIRFKFCEENKQINNNKINEIAEELLIKILLGSKIGNFQQHNDLPKLSQLISNQWNQQKCDIKQSAESAFKEIQRMFKNFQLLNVDDVALEKKQ